MRAWIQRLALGSNPSSATTNSVTFSFIYEFPTSYLLKRHILIKMLKCKSRHHITLFLKTTQARVFKGKTPKLQNSVPFSRPLDFSSAHSEFSSGDRTRRHCLHFDLHRATCLLLQTPSLSVAVILSLSLSATNRLVPPAEAAQVNQRESLSLPLNLPNFRGPAFFPLTQQKTATRV